MAFSSDDIFLPDDHCEICGAELSDEVVIQEFADGSIARLCSECAAGAALQTDTAEFRFPDEAPPKKNDDDSSLDDSSAEEAIDSGDQPAGAVPAPAAAAPAAALRAASADMDPLEKTRELLTPVVDLIGLQQEMQGALQRLATSLQTFATEAITEKADKSATVESRLEALENELELTRARLRETEALLAASAAIPVAAAIPVVAAVPVVATPQVAAPAPEPAVVPEDTAPDAAPEGAEPASLWDFDSTIEVTAEHSLVDTGEFRAPEITQSAAAAVAATAATAEAAPKESNTATQPYSIDDIQSTRPPVAPKIVPPPVAPPDGPPTAEHHTRPGFELPEVQIAQRYFNESQFTNRIRDVRKSLGKPKANLTKVVGAEPRALVTVFWDIIWYQYLVDLRRDIPADTRVLLHREGMDLEELTPAFREKNASVDDEGRLDASELEVKLLSDPSTLITEMSIDEERALEDATEEIWDQRTAPEFKWDA
jgi:hypothetical protein